MTNRIPEPVKKKLIVLCLSVISGAIKSMCGIGSVLETLGHKDQARTALTELIKLLKEVDPEKYAKANEKSHNKGQNTADDILQEWADPTKIDSFQGN